jgi:hypothetical protein
VTRSDGRLGNYGDDPSWKRRLLEIEGAIEASPATARHSGARTAPVATSGERRS